MTNFKTFKLFISSTFLDFQKERNALEAFVFPRLKVLCSSNGFNFQSVDLRWGVNKDVIENNHIIDFCLNEVSRCSNDPQPSLLVLLGQRYGWVPLPTKLSIAQWQALFEQASAEELSLLGRYYILDKNDLIPSYYLRDQKEADNWELVEEQLRTIFDKKNTETVCTYSATEHEIRYALHNNKLNGLVFSRTLLTDSSHKEYISQSLKEKESINKLKKDLFDNRNNKVIEHEIGLSEYIGIQDEFIAECGYEYPADTSGYIKAFCENIFNLLSDEIKQEMNSLKLSSPLEIELAEQRVIKSQKAKNVIGRENIVAAITAFLNTPSAIPFYLLHGRSGVGKSSAIAHTIDILELSGKYNLIYRFIGGTAQSSNIVSTLKSIQDEISINEPTVNTTSANVIIEKLSASLSKFKNDKKTVIFLDGLDQASRFDESLKKFIGSMPNNIKLVLSTISNEATLTSEAASYYPALNYTKHQYQVEPLSNNDNEIIIKKFLSEKGRTLTAQQSAVLTSICSEKPPIFINLACNIALGWKSSSIYSEKDLGGSADELVNRFFSNVSNKLYHKTELVELVLGLIVASKTGISEIELTNLLSEQEELLEIYNKDSVNEKKLTRLPDTFFSRLYYDIRHLFVEKTIDDEVLIYPAHRLIQESIKRNYYKSKSNKLHRIIINFFDKNENIKRKSRELCWSYYCLNDSKGLSDTLLNVDVFNSLFEIYKDNVEVIKYTNTISNKNPNFKSNILNRYLSELNFEIIDQDAIQFLDNISKIGSQSELEKPIKVIIEGAKNYQSEDVFNRLKYLLLKAKSSSGIPESINEVIEEINSNLLNISSNSELYFDFYHLLIQSQKSLGNINLAIELGESYIREHSAEQNIKLYSLLASYYKQMFCHEKAIAYYQLAADFYSEKYGEKNIEVAIIKGNMATVYKNMATTSHDNTSMITATNYLKEVVSNIVDTFGDNDYRLGAFYNSEANLLLVSDKLDLAELKYKKAFEIATFWNREQEIYAYFIGLSQILRVQNKIQEAYELCYKLICRSELKNWDDLHQSEKPFNNAKELITILDSELTIEKRIALEKKVLVDINKQLGPSHLLSLNKQLQIIIYLLDIDEEEESYLRFNELEMNLKSLPIEMHSDFYDISMLRNRFNVKKIEKLLDGAIKNQEKDNLEEALHLYEQAHGLAIELGMESSVKLIFEYLFSTVAQLSNIYYHQKRYHLAKIFTQRYYSMLCEHEKFGVNHRRTQEVGSILKALDSYLSAQ